MKKKLLISIIFISFIVVFSTVFFPTYLYVPYKTNALVQSIVIDSVEDIEWRFYVQCNLNVSIVYPDSCSRFGDYSVKTDYNKNLVHVVVKSWNSPRGGNSVCLFVVTYITVTISIILLFDNWTIWCNGLKTDLILYY